MGSSIHSPGLRGWASRLLFLAALAPVGLFGATYEVTSNQDTDTPGTLRWAINQANANTGSTINIAANLGTITFASQAPLISAAVTINGNTGTSISGGDAHRIFFVDTPNASDEVHLNNLILTHGYAKGGDGGAGGGGGGLGAGGALFINRGAVTVQNVSFTNNVAIGGNGGNGANTRGGGGGGGLGGNGAQGGYGGGGGGGYGGNGGSGVNGSGGGGGLIGNGGAGTLYAGGGGGGLGNGGDASGTTGGQGGTGGGGHGETHASPQSRAQHGSLYGGGGGGQGSETWGPGGNGGKFGGGGGGNTSWDYGGGNGGDFGGGGGSVSAESVHAGSGGFGGGGGGGAAEQISGNTAHSGNGGFGGGSGGAYHDFAVGSAGLLGGQGGAPNTHPSTIGTGGGGGGGAAGGAVFVRSDNGGTLTFSDSDISGSAVSAGSAGNTPHTLYSHDAQGGTAAGSGIFLNGGTATMQVSSGSKTLGDSISDAAFRGGTAASLAKTGSGTLVLSGSNNYAGGTAFNAGAIQVSNTGALGNTGALSFNGGALKYSAGVTTDYSSRFSTAANQQFKVDTNGQNVTFTSGLSSSGGTFTKQGSGVLTFAGSNSYTGATRIEGGTLRVENNLALYLNAERGITTTDGKITSPVTGWTDLSGRGNNATAVGNNLMMGTLGPGYLAVDFAGGGYFTTPLSSSGTTGYTFFTVIHEHQLSGGPQTILGSSENGDMQFRTDSGHIQVLKQTVSLISSSTSAITAGSPALVTATTVSGAQAFFIGSTLSGTSNATYSLDGNSFFEIGAKLNGQEALNGKMSALLVYDKVLTSEQISSVQAYLMYQFFGGPQVALPTALLSSSSPVEITTSGAALDINGTHQTIASLSGVAGSVVYLGNGELTIGDSTSTTFAGNISDYGGESVLSGGIVRKVGSGTLTLSGTNTYMGGTILDQGTLQIGSHQALSIGKITINGGNLRAVSAERNLYNDIVLNGNFTLGRLTNLMGPISLTNNVVITSANPDSAASTTSIIGGAISGTHSLTFTQGSNPIGTIILSGTNTYTGGTTIQAGRVQIEKDVNLGAVSGALTLDSGILKTTANIVSDRSVILGAGGGTFEMDPGYLTFNRGLSGQGALTKTGGNYLTLTGTQTYAGATHIQGGVFKLQDGSLASSSVDLAAGTFFYLTGNSSYNGTITGQGSLHVEGTATSTFTGSSNHTGGTSIDSGALQLGDGGTTGSVSGSIVNSGTLIYNRSDDISIGSLVTGNGTLVKRGGGHLTVTGSNAFSHVDVQDGILVVRNNHAFGNAVVRISAGTLSIGEDNAISNQILLSGGIYERTVLEGNIAHAVDATSSLQGGVATTARILAGSVNFPTSLSSGFNYGGGETVSDVYTFHGTGGSLFVLELSIEGTYSDAYLSWFSDEFDWVNARDGNHNNAEQFEDQFIGSFAQFQSIHGNTLNNYIGAWGVEVNSTTGRTSVWTVLNHNSQFAVIPEPSALLLVGLALLILAVWRGARKSRKATGR